MYLIIYKSLILTRPLTKDQGVEDQQMAFGFVCFGLQGVGVGMGEHPVNTVSRGLQGSLAPRFGEDAGVYLHHSVIQNAGEYAHPFLIKKKNAVGVLGILNRAKGGVFGNQGIDQVVVKRPIQRLFLDRLP